jgi:hypothetical protein
MKISIVALSDHGQCKTRRSRRKIAKLKKTAARRIFVFLIAIDARTVTTVEILIDPRQGNGRGPKIEVRFPGNIRSIAHLASPSTTNHQNLLTVAAV